VAETLFLLAVLAVPLGVGAATVFLHRPWWWGAILAIALVFVAAIAPEPEEGESRLVAGDLIFLLIVALVVAGLTWLGAWAARRLGGARD
jgi:cobalamin synthase